jgi:hypothetical protein
MACAVSVTRVRLPFSSLEPVAAGAEPCLVSTRFAVTLGPGACGKGFYATLSHLLLSIATENPFAGVCSTYYLLAVLFDIGYSLIHPGRNIVIR